MYRVLQVLECWEACRAVDRPAPCTAAVFSGHWCFCVSVVDFTEAFFAAELSWIFKNLLFRDRSDRCEHEIPACNGPQVTRRLLQKGLRISSPSPCCSADCAFSSMILYHSRARSSAGNTSGFFPELAELAGCYVRLAGVTRWQGARLG